MAGLSLSLPRPCRELSGTWSVAQVSARRELHAFACRKGARGLLPPACRARALLSHPYPESEIENMANSIMSLTMLEIKQESHRKVYKKPCFHVADAKALPAQSFQGCPLCRFGQRRKLLRLLDLTHLPSLWTSSYLLAKTLRD